jgi:hypothetical protein
MNLNTSHRPRLTIAGLIAIVSLTVSALTYAQPVPGTCKEGRATVNLDVNNVRAQLYNNGNLFWNGGQASGYNVPKAPEGKPIEPNAIFVNDLWIGGMVGGEVRTAATIYSGGELWPGPLNEAGELPNPDDCTPYDRIYTIYRADIERYNQTGETATNLAEWPWQLGAPVLDGDANPDNYDLSAGDRPALVGDQMAWWVMNDVGNIHQSTRSAPIQMEVKVTAFAFNLPGSLGNTTFYRYQLIYKGTAPLEETWLGFWFDADLGSDPTDNAGTDTTLRMVYAYKGDNFDEGEGGYGAAPPALGFSFMQGPLASPDGQDNDRDGEIDEPGERLRMTRSQHNTHDNSVTGHALTAKDYYNQLQGRWNDGTQMCFGGIGHYSLGLVPCTGVTPFMYPGDPITGAYWSMVNFDGRGNHSPVHNAGYFLLSTGPFRMEPGEEEEIVLAIVWSRGADYLDSIRKLRSDMKVVQTVYPFISTPDSTLSQHPEPELPATNAYTRNYPNPFTETTTIHYELADPTPVRLAVYDVLGREVARLVDEAQEAGFYDVTFDGRNLPVGVYVYRLQVGTTVATETLVRMR